MVELPLQILILQTTAISLPGRLELARIVPGDLLVRKWPSVYGALGLAILSVFTLVLAGRPWGETSGFTLWGAKILRTFGGHPEAWDYWRGSENILGQSLFADIISVVDFGILLGTMSGAALSGTFSLRRPANTWRRFWRTTAGLRRPPFQRMQYLRPLFRDGIRQLVVDFDVALVAAIATEIGKSAVRGRRPWLLKRATHNVTQEFSNLRGHRSKIIR